jgi:hypothetical protein
LDCQIFKKLILINKHNLCEKEIKEKYHKINEIRAKKKEKKQQKKRKS